MALIPIKNLPVIAPYGLKVVWGSNTTIKIGYGRCLDSTNTFDLVVDSSNTTASYITINSATTGVNGLDTGALAQGLYYVYLIGDSTRMHKTYGILSATVPATGPILPTGYDCFKDVGVAVADSNPYFVILTESGKGTDRKFTYDTAQLVLNAGTAYADYAAVSLTGIVPPVADEMVTFQASITPVASTGAGDSISLRQTGSAATTVGAILSGDVAAVATKGQLECPCGIASSVAKVDYKLTATGDAGSLWVSSFTYSL